jgi:purine nucleoside permease
LNYNLARLLGEQEQPSVRWEGVTRYVMAYVDRQGMLAVLVGFRPGSDPGHIDNVRCFVSLLGLASDFDDPAKVVGPLEDVAKSCEAQWGAELDKLFGKDPPLPSIAPVTRDPAAARLHQ